MLEACFDLNVVLEGVWQSVASKDDMFVLQQLPADDQCCHSCSVNGRGDRTF